MHLKLKAKNFLGFGEEVVNLDFDEIDGLVFISGENKDSEGAVSNGAGKSSIPDALLWGLYGITSRGLKYDEVINTVVGKNCVVEVSFTVGGDRFHVIRTRGHEIEGNSVELYRGDDVVGEELTARSMTETQKKIDEILGIDADTIVATNVFGQDTSSFVDYNESGRKEVFTKLTEYDFIDKLAEKTKEKINDTKGEIEEQERWLKIANRKLREFEDSNYGEKADAFEEERAKELSEIEGKLDNLSEKKQEELVGIADKWESKIEKLESEKEELEEFIVSEQKRAEELEDERDRHEENSKGLADLESKKKELEKRVAIRESRIDKLDKEIDRMENLGTGECPKCHSEVDEQHIDKIVKEFSEERSTARDKLKGILSELVDIEEKYEKAKRASKSFEVIGERIKGVRSTVIEKSRAVNTITRTLEAASEEIDEEIESVHAKYDSMGEDFNERRAKERDKENPYIELRDEVRHNIEELEESKAELEPKIESLQNRLEYLMDWKIAFGNEGIRSQLFDRIVNLLDNKIHKYMDILSEGSISVNIDTQTELKSGKIKDKFSIIVSDENGSRVYESYSGGEKKRVKLAVDLALSDVVCEERERSLDFAIFDEVLSGLDEVGRLRAIDMWKEQIERGDKRLILVVDHDLPIQEMFDRKIDVIRENGFSRVEI